MNWKDVPHLFANGKFNVKSPRIITGKFDGIEEGEEDSWVIYSRGQVAMLDECTLIARKIDSLTDEERQPILNMMGYDDMTWEEYSADRESFFYSCTSDNSHPEKEIEDVIINTTDGTLYALSIGVYPFDQSHFGETVIDIKTL